MKYVILNGTADECQNALNRLMEDYYLTIEGFSSTDEQTAILVLLQSKK